MQLYRAAPSCSNFEIATFGTAGNLELSDDSAFAERSGTVLNESLIAAMAFSRDNDENLLKKPT